MSVVSPPSVVLKRSHASYSSTKMPTSQYLGFFVDSVDRVGILGHHAGRYWQSIVGLVPEEQESIFSCESGPFLIKSQQFIKLWLHVSKLTILAVDLVVEVGVKDASQERK